MQSLEKVKDNGALGHLVVVEVKTCDLPVLGVKEERPGNNNTLMGQCIHRSPGRTGMSSSSTKSISMKQACRLEFRLGIDAGSIHENRINTCLLIPSLELPQQGSAITSHHARTRGRTDEFHGYIPTPRQRIRGPILPNPATPRPSFNPRVSIPEYAKQIEKLLYSW